MFCVIAADRSNSFFASSNRFSLSRKSPPPNGRQKMIVLQGRFIEQFVDEIQAFRRAERHRDRDGAVEGYDWRGDMFQQLLIQHREARRIGLVVGHGTRMTCGDRGLQPAGLGELLVVFHHRFHATADMLAEMGGRVFGGFIFLPRFIHD
jgi:hypothetical protein